MSTEKYANCDTTCTTDCGHCKGEGKPAVQVARNERNHGIYEVHKAGCAHLNLRHMDVMNETPYEVTGSYAVFAEQQADENEGCLYQVGPCLKRGDRVIYGYLP